MLGQNFINLGCWKVNESDNSVKNLYHGKSYSRNSRFCGTNTFSICYILIAWIFQKSRVVSKTYLFFYSVIYYDGFVGLKQ